MLSYDFGWYRASSGQPGTAITTAVCTNAACTTTANAITATQNASNNTTDNNLDYYQGGATVNWAKWLNTGLYYIYGRNAASANPAVASQQFLGFDRDRRPRVLEV